MSAPSLSFYFRRKKQELTLRTRLALLSAMLLIILSVGLVLFINLVATVTTPYTETALLPMSSAPTLEWQPGQPTPEPIVITEASLQPFTPMSYAQIRQTVLGQLGLISLIGLALVIVVGAISTYWMAGRALRPLSEVSKAARGVSAATLDTRVIIRSPGQEVSELAEAFDSMLDRLRESFAKQGQFVSNAAHELRTPLAILRANLEVAYSDTSATVEDYRQMSPVLERTLTRLEDLLSDLLIMATEEQALTCERVSLERLIEDLLSDLRPLADERQVALCFDSRLSVSVRGDPLLLSRVFSNLVENGIRYNHKNGEVVVAIYRAGSNVLVTVGDTGFGIPVDEQAHIFDRFYRGGESRSQHKRGAGLGLSIVSHIVQLHRGKILVDSMPGVGSKFTVQLPM